jgi:hypothetical protein
MKKISFLLLLVLFLSSCSKKAEISVFNNSDVDRIGEIVEICLCSLPDFDNTKIVVVDSAGNQVPYQLLNKGNDKPQSIIFPVSLEAGKSTKFIVQEGIPSQIKSKTFVRFVPERKDDIAWENDRIAFRMYGPALAAENPSNGVDVWYKRTPELIIDKWYKNDLSGKASYHDDNGEGLDCYKVAHTLGAGSVAPFSDDSLYVYNHFDRYKILDNGPLQSSFVLFYDKIPFGSHKLKAEMMITINAGSNLNEARIKYTGDTTGFQLAAGIFLHDSIQSINTSTEKGYLGYAEDLISETKNHLPSGRGYTGVVFPGSISDVRQVSGHLIGISNYKTGEEFRYFFGAGWSKFGYGSDQDWFGYLSSQKTAILQPLELKIYR